MKLVTVAAAAEAVGWDYRFETRLLAAGAIEQGALLGDLVVVGSGDPSVLGRAGDDDMNAWIDALREKGITRVEGRIVADDNAVEEPRPGFAWSWDDLGYTYGAVAGALNFAENRFELLIRPGGDEGLPTIVETAGPGQALPVANHSVTGPPGGSVTLWPELRPGETRVVISGEVPAGAEPVRLAIAAGNPTLWFAESVRSRLLSAGIAVAGQAVDADELRMPPALDDAAVLHVHRSRPLWDIASALLKDSINMYAEAVLRLATGPDGVRATGPALDATRLRLESWGVAPDAAQIVDGSGLSRRNVIAPDALVTLLRRWHEPRFVEALPTAGRDGTLDRRMKDTPAEGNAAAKTGSLSNVRTLAGYVTTADGERLVFAVMANNYEGTSSTVTATIDRIVARLASFSRSRR